MHPGLKKIVFRKLNQDLSKVEIILSENQSIWFIDRANKYWYFELEKSGKLWWRYEFFTDFFILFCIEVNEFQPFLSEWVEGILNSGVSSTCKSHFDAGLAVEDILNRRVSATGDLGMERIATVEGIFDSNVNMTTQSGHRLHSTVESILNHGYRKGSRKVDEVLNHKVVITEYCGIIPNYDLEEVLNHKVVSTLQSPDIDPLLVEEVLNREVNMTVGYSFNSQVEVEDMLNHKVVSISNASENSEFVQQVLVNDLLFKIESATPLDTPASDSVDQVLSYKVTRTIPDLNESLTEIDILLTSIVPLEIP